MSNNFKVKRVMFFAVTDDVVEENLTKEEAESRCKIWKEGSDIYTDFFVSDK